MPTKRDTMKKGDPDRGDEGSLLQEVAIEKLNNSPKIQESIPGKTSEERMYDLQVHQVELEIQAEELRQAHLTVEESRDQYLDLYEFAPVGYITLSNTAIISQANLTAATLLRVDRKNLIHTRFRTWIDSQDRDIWDRYMANLLRTDTKLTITCRLKRNDGTVFPARLESINLIRNSHNQSIRVAISDISDLKKTENELKASQDRFRLAIQNAHVSVAIQDTDLIFQWGYNQQIMQNEEIKGKKDTDLFTQEDAHHLIDLKRRVLETGNEVHEKIWMNIQGRRMFLELNLQPIRDDKGRITGIGTATLDLTEQKLIEDALRHSEENLQRTQEILEAVTKGTEVLIAAQDIHFCYIFFNQAYKEEMKRRTGKDLALGSSMIDIFEGEPQGNTVQEWRRVLQGDNVNLEVEFGEPGKNRRVYHVLYTPIRDAQGTIIGAGEVAYDVTTQVLMDEELRETKDYQDNLITYANAPIIVWDPKFRITLFNRAFEQLTGRTAHDVIGKQLDMLFHERYLASVMELIKRTKEGERWESVEIPILHKNGDIRTVLWNSASIFGSDGKTIVSTIAQGQDITDRKKNESEFRLRATEYEKLNETLNEEIRQRTRADTALKKTLSLLHASLESTADGIFVIDHRGNISSYNQNFASMWNIPRNILESGEAHKVLDLILPQIKTPEKFADTITNFHSHPTRESFDMIEFIDGKIFERYSKPQNIGDIVVGRVWSFRDITDRKRAERKLVSSLQEKEVLLREIHHRVKNNLQLISGLLDMTRMRTEDESIYSILTDMMLKIQTMAQIHTRLYESKQFGKINITDQIRDQSKALSNIYSKEGHEITCEIQPNEVFLPVDLALPSALVVNEILSNAYKHAFTGREKGTIDISVGEMDGSIRISIHDNGIGIPDPEEISRSNSLGVKLIRTLVQHQLKGSLSITSVQGTQVLVEFPYIAKG
ncbi:MAG: PAS domain S-box protein [Methanospirillum sp.]|uniref:PAS domain-containing sensor histidine kinase n=1 Tax=Methanospirillum sp. TaxID=45200 RepID=UPI002372BAC9|nr:PAS domain S-box protein [Methanospirillum sp.]MDD1729697.1 PAS domain S-box protein [Methanospirillum sp.]